MRIRKSLISGIIIGMVFAVQLLAPAGAATGFQTVNYSLGIISLPSASVVDIGISEVDRDQVSMPGVSWETSAKSQMPSQISSPMLVALTPVDRAKRWSQRRFAPMSDDPSICALSNYNHRIVDS